MDTSNEFTPEPTDARDDASTAHLLRTADRLLRLKTRESLKADGVHPGHLRALRALADGRFDLRHGGRLVRGLVSRGWAQVGFDGVTITDDGREALERLTAVASDTRADVVDALTDEQTAALRAGLTALIDAAGGVEALEQAREARRERQARRADVPGFPWGPGLPFTPRFGGPGRGFRGPRADRRHDCEPDGHKGHGHKGHGHKGHHHEHRAEQAFERGFAAGVDAARRTQLDG